MKKANAKAAEKRPIGRPCSYTKAVADEICARLASGETILQMCKKNAHLPSERTVYMWLFDEDKAEFLQKYEKARAVQAERMAEELADIADDGKNDYMERLSANGEDVGGWAVNGEHIQRSRLRVDTRKWIAARLLPKKYGDRIQNEHSGKLDISIENIQNLSDSELLEKIKD